MYPGQLAPCTLYVNGNDPVKGDVRPPLMSHEHGGCVGAGEVGAAVSVGAAVGATVAGCVTVMVVEPTKRVPN